MNKQERILALIGNPNCGKTTIFNGLTGGNHRIGNWPGVTVEKKEGSLRMTEPGTFLAEPFIGQGEILDQRHTVRPNRQTMSSSDKRRPTTIVDLPGIYSLTATTEDEQVARDFLLYQKADLIVNILDAANLERNLYLTLQLLELGVPMVLVLNMIDMAEGRGISIDEKALSEALGVPVIAVQGTRKKDIFGLAALLSGQVALPSKQAIVEYSPIIQHYLDDPNVLRAAEETGIGQLLGVQERESKVMNRWLAIQVLENPPLIRDVFGQDKDGNNSGLQALLIAREKIRDQAGEDPDILAAEDKYGFIGRICSRSMEKKPTRQSLSDKVDTWVMHRFLGIPIFLLIMYGVFWFTISVGGAFIDFFDIAGGALFVDGLSNVLWRLNSPEWLTGILAQGIGTGLQTVSTFIPIIFSMFFALTLLEDSGYMARAAFVMDRFMQFLGLPGKAFIPMMVGFGCTVPGIMGTRTLESTKDRFTTIFMTPFMSCGARLPVYALFVVALFPKSSGLVVFSIYLAGILLAVLTGLLLKLTVFKGASSHFVMELPPYHAPRFGYTFSNSASRVKSFVLRAGAVIVFAVGLLSILNSVAISSDGVSFGEPDREDSVLSAISKGITPVFTPMGIDSDNWPATVGLFTGVFAKEVVVGTLNSLYAQEGGFSDSISSASPATPEEWDFSLLDSLWEAVLSIPENLGGLVEALFDPLGIEGMADLDEETLLTSARVRDKFSPAQGYGYMLFILIYTPCLAAVGAGIREMGKKWGTWLAVYLLLLAWAVSTLFYQIAEGGSFGLIGLAVGILLTLIGVFVVAGQKIRTFKPLGQNK